MIKISKITLLFLVYLTISACSKENNSMILLEQVLPGKWNIESIELPAKVNGIEYKGVDFYNDTILYDVGSIEFPLFSCDTLGLGAKEVPQVWSSLIIEVDTFNLLFERAILSEDDYFVYYRGVSLPGYENENFRFISSSNLLCYNAIIDIENDNKLRIVKANDDGYIVNLSRIR